MDKSTYYIIILIIVLAAILSFLFTMIFIVNVDDVNNINITNNSTNNNSTNNNSNIATQTTNKNAAENSPSSSSTNSNSINPAAGTLLSQHTTAKNCVLVYADGNGGTYEYIPENGEEGVNPDGSTGQWSNPMGRYVTQEDIDQHEAMWKENAASLIMFI